MKYLRRTLNYLERIILFYLNCVMSMTELVTIVVYTPMIDSRCSLEKESIELIHMNI